MRHRKHIRITVLKTEFYKEIAEKYAVPSLGPCPLHEEGQIYFCDGENKPDGLCESAWEPMKEYVLLMSEGKPAQPTGTWMADDAKGVFACADGVRPIILLAEALEGNAESADEEPRA